MINQIAMPKFAVGQHVIPTSIDREEYPEGYVIGLIEWRNFEWIYWQTFDNGDVMLGAGFAEQHLEVLEAS